MSLNVVPTPVVAVEYPKTKITNQRKYAILKGSAETSYGVFPSSSISNSQVQWSAVNPPGPDYIVDRLVWARMTFEIDFKSTGNTGTQKCLHIGSSDALRAYPIAICTNTLAVTINNDQVSNNLNEYWSALSRYHNYMANKDKFLSKSPVFPDLYQEYNNAVDGVPVLNPRNALAGYDNSPLGQLPRGAFNYDIVANNLNDAKVIVTVTEPLFISPFLFSEFDYMESGLVGVNNMSVTMTFNLNRIWSHFDGQTAGVMTSIVPKINQAELLFTYYTPNILDTVDNLSWPYFEITPYITNITSSIPAMVAVDPASVPKTLMVMNSVQLKQIPQKIYVFAREQNAFINGSNAAADAWSKCDCFLPIRQLTVSLGNRTGLLSTATQQDLYEMSRKNGLDMNWLEFSGLAMPNSGGIDTPVRLGNNALVGTCGGPICIKLGEDIGLDALSAPGLTTNLQLSLQAEVLNVNSTRAIFPSLYVVVIYEGTISLVNGSFMHQVGVFSSKDVLDSNSPGFPTVPYQINNHVYGGASLKGAAEFLRKVGRYLKENIPKLRKRYASVAPFVPSGLHGPISGLFAVSKALGAGRRAPRARPRSSLLARRGVRGGRLISRGELADRMDGNISDDVHDE